MENATLKDIVPKVSIKPQDSTNGASITGTGVDCRGFKSMTIILSHGTLAPDGLSCALKLQESSDDGSTDAYADISGAAFSAKAGTADNTTYIAHLDLRNRERYIRAYAAITGSPTAHNVSVIFLLHNGCETPGAGTTAFDLGTSQPEFFV